MQVNALIDVVELLTELDVPAEVLEENIAGLARFESSHPEVGCRGETAAKEAEALVRQESNVDCRANRGDPVGLQDAFVGNAP
jgi:hypothetical protein